MRSADPYLKIAAQLRLRLEQGPLAERLGDQLDALLDQLHLLLRGTPRDTTGPTATLSLDDSALAAGESAVLTLRFSEPVQGLDLDDLVSAHGTFSALTPAAEGTPGTVFTVVFTPEAGIEVGDSLIRLLGEGYGDRAGNAGSDAQSGPLAIDTRAPTLAITLGDLQLSRGETATVSLDFSEAVQGLGLDDLVADGASLSDLQQDAADPRRYTATLTPDADTLAAAGPTVRLVGAYTDAAGNAGSGATSTAYAIDTVATRIHAVQGAGEASAQVGQTVTVEARVTAWTPGLNLFWLEEEGADRDGDAATSEGIAVFYGSGAAPVTADSIGDIVRLSGRVTEFNGLTELTQISGYTVVQDGSAADLEAATALTLPIADGTTLERHEGMRVTVSAASGGDLFVADTFTFARFGETTLHADAVPTQFTETQAPSVAGYQAHQAALARNSIQLDDGSSVQNPSLAALNSGSRITRDTTDDGVANGTALGVQADGSVSFLRAGDHTASVSGVLGYSFGSYELLPTETVALTAAPRPDAPQDLGEAEIRVASFNVLNYFTTLGTASFTNPEGVSHAGRGASTAAEFQQQQAKIVAAMLATGADVFALNELQNNGDGAGSAIASLVGALNAAVGEARYAWVAGHASGGDAIRVGIVYDQTAVQTLGAAATPDRAVYTAFADSHRLPLAQTFAYADDASKQFTLVVNHLKSKGGSGTGADADQGDGQGQFNAARLAAVQQLGDWLGTDPTGARDGDYVLAGDLNSYSMEDPVRFLQSAGYTLHKQPGDYSYVFDGLRGSLDHLLSRGLAEEITGVAHFNLNADEQVALDYNDEFTPDDLDALDRDDAYRSSDHDPVILGLKLASEAGSPVNPPADRLAPTLLGSSPADGAVDVALDADLVLQFSETVQRGPAAAGLRLVDEHGGVRLLGADEVRIEGSTVTLDPAADLAGGTRYALRIDAGALTDAAGNAYAGLLDDTALDFRSAAAAPVQGSVRYSESFDTLATTGTANSSLPAGWALLETGGGARDNELYAAGTGSSSTGDSYSFGAEGSTERALGGLQSGTLLPTVGASFLNSSGQTVQQVALSYVGEQWRLGATGRTDRLDLQFSTDASSLGTGQWTDVDALDFLAPVSAGTVGALDGNAAAHRVAIGGSFAVELAAGQSLWLRWRSVDVAGADDGLAIDELSLTLIGASALGESASALG